MPSDNSDSHISGSEGSDISAAAVAQYSQDLEDYFDEVYPDSEEEANRHRGGFTKDKQKEKEKKKDKGKGKKDDKKQTDSSSHAEQNRHRDGYKTPPRNNQK
ncbi:hypothetical protein PG984_008089 [Apiospora sp. TS-2023a]